MRLVEINKISCNKSQTRIVNIKPKLVILSRLWLPDCYLVTRKWTNAILQELEIICEHSLRKLHSAMCDGAHFYHGYQSSEFEYEGSFPACKNLKRDYINLLAKFHLRKAFLCVPNLCRVVSHGRRTAPPVPASACCVPPPVTHVAPRESPCDTGGKWPSIFKFRRLTTTKYGVIVYYS